MSITTKHACEHVSITKTLEDHTSHVQPKTGIVFTSHGTVLHSSCGSTDVSLASTARRVRNPYSRETQCGNQAVATSPEEETRGEPSLDDQYSRALCDWVATLEAPLPLLLPPSSSPPSPPSWAVLFGRSGLSGTNSKVIQK